MTAVKPTGDDPLAKRLGELYEAAQARIKAGTEFANTDDQGQAVKPTGERSEVKRHRLPAASNCIVPSNLLGQRVVAERDYDSLATAHAALVAELAEAKQWHEIEAGNAQRWYMESRRLENELDSLRAKLQAAERAEYLDTREFYEVMQSYRWANRDRDKPAEAVAAYEAVKAFIRAALAQTKGEGE